MNNKFKIPFLSLLLGLTSVQATAAVCTYSVDKEWSTGYNATVTIANNGSTSINGWSLSIKYATNRISTFHSATITGTNPYTASNESYNRTIDAGSSVSFGYKGLKNGGAVETPVLSGGVCNSTPVSSSSSSATPVSSSSKSSSSSSSKSSSKSSTAPSSSSSSRSGGYSANVDSLKALASFPIGAGVGDSGTYNIVTNASEKALLEKHFNQITAGNIMKVSYLHPTKDSFTFANADAFVDYAKSKNMTVHGHTLVWHPDYQVPDFIKNWTGTKDAFLTMLDTHVITIVDHFEAKGNVVSWDVVNEALDDSSPSNFRTDSAFYIKSGNSAVYIERAFKAARLADPAALLYYNDYNIEGNNSKTTKLIEMITDFQARSIPIDGVGFQMHISMTSPSVANIKAAMQKVVNKGLKVKISELDIPINTAFNNWPASKVPVFTQEVALNQKKRYCEIVKAYLDTVPVNQRGGISTWGLTDGNSWIDYIFKTEFNNEKLAWPLLFDINYKDKPALRGFADGLLGTACTNL